MRRMFVILCLLLSGCHRVSDAAKELPPPKAYVHFKDRVAAQMLDWGIPWRFPCMGNETDDQCFRFTKPQRMRGLWRNDFEGSRFCEQRSECGDVRTADSTWLEMKFPLAGREDTPPGGLYAIDFIGRRSEKGGLFGGQMGAHNEIIVDRLLSIEEVEAPVPGQMTREHRVAYLQACRGVQICMPNSEVTDARRGPIHFFVPGDVRTIL